MAPKSTALIPSQDVDNTTKPSWNTSPNTFPQFYTKLLKWLPKQETKYTTLVQYYYVLNGGQVCCISADHAARASAKLLVKGSFKNPQFLKSPHDVVSAPPLTSHPSQQPPPPASPDAAASGLGSAPPPTPIQTVMSSGDPSSNKNRYVEMCEVVEDCAASLYTLIAECVEDDDTMDEILENQLGSIRNGESVAMFNSKVLNSNNWRVCGHRCARGLNGR